ncbi:sensor domain-containing diguanylate cyclase [Sulfurospirillum barnesii]|uniref:diguanylate cyclase n=1 Tax=Sulfurospirillum barnesii (strain ATCC 700032 / DSM 10660 / SES-3) TaxID=760154 RepID=I3XY43_SULBS|nr:diguanylate cyclase [Sulfurospirillum barnesii]AFL68867.1 diguanylate cyclase (GGDEF) domain-containing protein [Sulfurospirillum barnesii SES-3]
MNLYNKVLFLSFLQLGTIFVFGIYQIQSLYLTQKRAFDQKNVMQAEVIQKRFEEKQQSLQKTAHILINSQEVITGILSHDTDMLYNWSKLFLSSTSEKIHFMDLDGTIISRGEAEFNFGDDTSQRFYVRQALQNDTFLGIDFVDGEECLIYAKRVKQYGQRPIGVISLAIVIDNAFLNTLVQDTSMTMTYTSTHQTLSTSIEPFLPQALSSSLHVTFQTGGAKDANFSISPSSEEELYALKEARNTFLIGISLALLILMLALHFTLLKHLKEHKALSLVLIDFYEDRLSIHDLMRAIKHTLHQHTTPEIKKIAEALFNMSEKIAHTQTALEHSSTTDQLTALANRRKVEEYLEQKIEESKRGAFFSIIMIDIDHFKNINDTYGHAIGDHVLIHTARLMSASIRESDMLGRWGGEEFLLILPNTPLDGALRIAEHIRATLHQHTFEHYPEFLSMSLGVATHQPNDTSKTILKRADNALYKAKNGGRNQVQHES